ncbi:hypothetical protein [Metabacillus halosaccharovorans]|nr:hypothetical protein [Metabacillus halosaccharovorans]
MPVGIQFIGNAFNEEMIIKAAYAFECTNPMENRKSQLDGVVESV